MTVTIPRWVLIGLGIAVLIGGGIVVGVLVSGGGSDGSETVADAETEESDATTDEPYVPPTSEEVTETPEADTGPPTCDEAVRESRVGICEGEKPGSEFELAYLDQTLKLDSLTARVEGVSTAPYVGQRFIREHASGVYVIVELAITNQLSRPQSFGGGGFDEQTALNVSDNLYNEDFDAQNQSDQQSFVSQGEDIGPGITQVGHVIYDVPQEVANDVLSPRTNGVVIIEEFGRARGRPAGAIVLRDQDA